MVSVLNTNFAIASDMDTKTPRELINDFEKYRKKALNGDAESQHILGFIYRITGKKTEAVRWYNAAAEQKYAGAQFAMGNIYSKGMAGIKPDMRKAIDYYKKAAKQGHVKAQNNLASLYYYGNGVRQDFEKAISWYYAAAKQGYPKAQHSLGQMYEVGEGTTKDLRWAYMWYKFAADKGFIESRSAISRVTMTMSKKENKEAIDLYNKWAGNYWAQNTGNEYNNHSLE